MIEYEFINEGTFQEFDYNNETRECEWKKVHEQSKKNLLQSDYYVWGG